MTANAARRRPRYNPDDPTTPMGRSTRPGRSAATTHLLERAIRAVDRRHELPADTLAADLAAELTRRGYVISRAGLPAAADRWHA